jgi:hypothetical protein
MHKDMWALIAEQDENRFLQPPEPGFLFPITIARMHFVNRIPKFWAVEP